MPFLKHIAVSQSCLHFNVEAFSNVSDIFVVEFIITNKSVWRTMNTSNV